MTFAQLRALGLDQPAIAYRAKAGRLHRVHHGVYAVGHRRVAPIDRAAAAVLACGPGAVLSHGSAATLWGLTKHWQMPFEVIVAADRRPAGIKVHRIRALTKRDITTHHGIRVTRPARTLLDVAPALNPNQLTRAVNDGRLASRVSLDGLAEIVDRVPRHPGAKLLRPFVETCGGPTRSGFEDAFIAFTARYELPTPQINVIMLGHEVDAFFPEHRLVVELDSYEYHSDQPTFESDRKKDADRLEHGIGTVRITWKRLTEQHAQEAARFHAILNTRRAA